MWCSNKDRVTTDSVHVDTGGSLKVIQVNIAILCDQENSAVFGTCLQ